MEERVYAESRAAGATEKTSDIQSKILEFLWWMKKNGYKESTITDRGRRLRRFIKLGANLFDPESVKEVIANQSWSEARKEAMVYTYDLWAKWVGIKWEKPSYKPPRKLPFIPLEREIDDLIASCNKYIATFLQMAKETGARAGEIYNLKWTDIDFENSIVTVVPEKGSDPRAFKISGKLITMLNKLPRNGDKVFGHYGNLNSLRRCFERYRRRAADKFGNPRLLKISFHTLRHWKATMEYAKTKDILHVMKTLGHRRIENTLIYTQLVKFESDEYVCKVAKEPEEIAKLIEAGFEYVCEHNGLKFFRKRK
ncbi:MAG: site-specific integrase [Nitrososphaerota archaeon]